MTRDCLFCEMAGGQRVADKLYEDEKLFAVRDIHPRAPVHFMVIPKEHIPTVAGLSADHGSLLIDMFKTAHWVAQRQGIAEEGYRLAINYGEIAGMTISHLHLHVLGGRHLGPEG